MIPSRVIFVFGRSPSGSTGLLVCATPLARLAMLRVRRLNRMDAPREARND